jgi:hypothetical protein
VWPGIVTALEATDHVGPFAEPIDDLSLALVAPLRADDHDICHFRLIVRWAAGPEKPRRAIAVGTSGKKPISRRIAPHRAIRFVPDFHRDRANHRAKSRDWQVKPFDCKESLASCGGISP